MTPSAKPAPFFDPTLRDYVIDHRMQGHTTKTLKCRRDVLALLARYLGKPLIQATEDDLIRWYFSYEGSAQWTLITYGRAVRSYYRWALRRQMVTSDPSLVLPIPSSPRPTPNPLTSDEIRLALAEADPRTRLFLLLAIGAGLRAIEISRMRREDLSDSTGHWVLTVPSGKGGKRRAVVVSAFLAAEVCAWRRTPGRMFDLTPTSVSNVTNTFLHSLGITRTLHKGRHAFGSTVYAATRDLLATAEALGHSSPATVTFYAQAAPEARAEALAALDDLMRGPVEGTEAA